MTDRQGRHSLEDSCKGMSTLQSFKLTGGFAPHRENERDESLLHSDDPKEYSAAPSEFFDLDVLKGAVSFDTKPFKHRALVWVGFKKVVFFPMCCQWWLARISPLRYAVGCVLFILQVTLALLYFDRSLPGCSPTSCGTFGSPNIVQMEVILPLVISAVFGVGYGSVVAAAGWEALRNPAGSDTAPSVTTEECEEEDEEEEDEEDQEEDDDEANGGGGGPASLAKLDDRQRRGHGTRSPDVRPSGMRRRERKGNASRHESGLRVLHPEVRRVETTTRGARPERAEGGYWVGKSEASRLEVLAEWSDPVEDLNRRASSVWEMDEGWKYEEEDEDEEEDGGGWGRGVVQPVKVSVWDGAGRHSNTFMSLRDLRAVILGRAGCVRQKAAYRNAVQLGLAMTVLLPSTFHLWTLTASFEHALHSLSSGGGNETSCWASEGKVGSTGGAVYNPSEACAAGGIGLTALGGLHVLLRPLTEWPLLGHRAWDGLRALAVALQATTLCDWSAATVGVVSLCSVAYVAWPTFHALAEAERTYQRRSLYSKFFCALTSSQRARKYRLPHFSLKNVANIRMWLALRAGKNWLRQHRKERSADAVVSSAFVLAIALLSAILFEALSKDSHFLSTLVHWELLVWCCFISFFLLRFMTLGSRTNNRYRDVSVLLTEQINVQLRILQNNSSSFPDKVSQAVDKRERLVVSNNVLKLATKLLKELDGPNKLSGLSMNPVLYNITRVVLVSALSGVMTETLGFKLKLWKILKFK
ncbi:unnamed protein product [Choristocarpus tenellus]